MKTKPIRDHISKRIIGVCFLCLATAGMIVLYIKALSAVIADRETALTVCYYFLFAGCSLIGLSLGDGLKNLIKK